MAHGHFGPSARKIKAAAMTVRIKVRGLLEEMLEAETGRHWAHDVLVFTRHWIHYGTLAFIFVTTLAAAARGLFAGLP